MRQTPRAAQRILFAIVVFVVTVALLGSIFGAEITWRALILAAAITFFLGSCQLVIERDRAKRAELDRFRKRAGKRETPPV